MEAEQQTIQQLFHREFSKMVAVISQRYGLSNIQLAEDVVSETFLKAAERWEVEGRPENPTAWLYVVAKRRALHHFRRKKIFDRKVSPELRLRRQEDRQGTPEPDFSMQNIRDSQLQMLFAVCHPAIASEAQIGLALRTLCGFGIDEITEAFFSSKETINKRLYRARKKLRTENITMEMPPESKIPGRLDRVLHIIYLLFNEGYYSKTQNQTLRKDLCLEALRLGLLLTGHEQTDLPKTNALVALMCFHASRFEARQAARDAIVLYDRQDPSLWNSALIRQGMRFLEHSASGGEVSTYHLEARIASWHCIRDTDSTEKWKHILQLYDQLLKINYSPTVAMNRIYALYKTKGAPAALPEAEKLDLKDNHFYFALLGELHRHIDPRKAGNYFQKAHSLANTQPERQLIQAKIDGLSQPGSF
ncbi:RNA polymerase sigma factor [Fodinibius sediminis]|uniref:RNA polymerase sigma-70 factor, ECF subfamily n=1 Tax=Fodinibius sediminis TaxID=1214077 RepID=A0A521ELA8_9BACT|nr:sigma-70 family RNA polymerase sigma factor [Fodinibius sediminis]SMO84672.1 RNA polymerase sigma-70 factor, ECF subfamily [Fodinibius sediminis]